MINIVDDFNVEKPDIERNLRALLLEKEAEIERLTDKVANRDRLREMADAEIERLRAYNKIAHKEIDQMIVERSALKAEIERLRVDNELLQADRNRWREMWGELDARAALEPKP